MAVYLDTSVLVGFVFGEAGWHKTSDAVVGHQIRFLGDLALGEFVDTIARRVRDRQTSLELGHAIIAGVMAFFSDWTRVEVAPPDVATATDDIASDLGRPLKLADAIHLAMAARVGATLITADRQRAKAAAALGIDHFNPTFP